MLIPVISTIHLWSCYATGVTTDYINWKNQHCKWGRGICSKYFVEGCGIYTMLILDDIPARRRKRKDDHNKHKRVHSTLLRIVFLSALYVTNKQPLRKRQKGGKTLQLSSPNGRLEGSLETDKSTDSIKFFLERIHEQHVLFLLLSKPSKISQHCLLQFEGFFEVTVSFYFQIFLHLLLALPAVGFPLHLE